MRFPFLLAGAMLCSIAFAQAPSAAKTVKQTLLDQGFDQSDIQDLVIRDSYSSNGGAVTHTYYNQRYEGIELFNSDIAVHTLSNGSVLHLTHRAEKNLASRVNSTVPGISAQGALQMVLSREQDFSFSVPQLLSTDKSRLRYFFEGEQFNDEAPRAQLMLLPFVDEVRLVWNVSYYLPDGSHWWNVRIDASTGQEYERNDWVVECLFHDDDHGCHDHDSNLRSNEPVGSFLPAAPNDYNVFALPEESPSHGPRSIQNAPWNAAPSASPFGWHDTDGIAGPENFTTIGNNVWAQEDRNANNGTDGHVADGGPDLDFDFPLDLTLDPIQYEDAAITNLFYWNNVIHDVLYVYGFDEVSGNFQENNYGNGGAGGDHVWADAQDGSGSNNANFGTPDDGSNPRMQMFLWTGPNPDKDGDLDNGIIAHEYGHGWSNRLIGGPTNTNCMFNAEQMGEGWSDYLGLILTMKPGDTRTSARGIGTFALDQPVTGPGIRPAPYSTDFAVNNYTYANTNSGVSQPHGIGFVWCTMLWDLTWDLIDVYGFDADIYNGTGGNNIALKLVSDGLKLTACEPGFVDGRDAILQADQLNYGGANFNLIWSAFAKRGLGFSADQGSTSSRSDQVEAFDLPVDTNARAVALLEPGSGKILDCENAPFNVRVTVANAGLLDLTDIPVSYRLDGGAVVQETLFGTLGTGATANYAFSTVENITTPGFHVLEVWTSALNDQNTTDDTLTVQIELVATIVNGASAFEDFESESLCGTNNDCEQTICDLTGIWFNSENGVDDDVDWRVNSGTTASAGTGPSQDYSPGTGAGQYVYIEASGSCNNQTAVLNSPCIDLTGYSLPTLTFAYHMLGSEMGALAVDVNSGSGWVDDIWTISGDQGSDWNVAYVDLLTHSSASVKLRIRGTTGTGFQSDIAIDAIDVIDAVLPPIADFGLSSDNICGGGEITLTDLSVLNPTSWQWSFTPNTITYVNGTSASSQNPQVSVAATGNYEVRLIASNAFGMDTLTVTDAFLVASPIAPPFYTDFESENVCTITSCGSSCPLTGIWNNSSDDQTDWFVSTGTTSSSGTGPSTDFDPGNSSGQYVYMEATGCQSSQADLVSTCLDISSLTIPTLEFSSHMYGSDMGELHLDVFFNGTWSLDVIPVISGDQGNAWFTRSVDLSAYASGGVIRIRFRGITGNGFQSDIALDAIRVFEGAAAPVVNFNADQTNVCGTVTIQLTDVSSLSPTAWNWTITPATFNYVNGTNSTSQNPQIELIGNGTYTVELTATNTYGSNNFIRTSYLTKTAGDPFELIVTTDQYPGEITWRLLDLGANVISTGGPYSSTGVQPSEYICVPDSDCFVLEFNDSFGDGIFSPGGYVLRTLTGDTLVLSDGSYGQQQVDTFCVVTDVSLDLKVLLEGPYDGVSLMDDDIRQAGAVPLTEPYTSFGYAHVGSGGESIDPTLLALTGNDAIVDWLMVELRSQVDPSLVIATFSAVVDKAGIVKAPDGGSIAISVNEDDYYVAVRHRNHLGCMTANSVTLSATVQSIDFSDPLTLTWGTEARKQDGSVMLLWAGNVVRDGELKYIGTGNDRDPILTGVGGSVPTGTVNGYVLEDVNMDYVVKYVGTDNDRDIILVNIGGSSPTAVRLEQIP